MVADFREVLANERQALDLVIRRCAAEPATVAQACEVLRGHARGRRERRVIVSGIGKAGLIARKVAATLSSTGTAAAFIHPVEALHGDLGFVQPEDCAVLMSYSGETVELIRLADELRRLNCPIVGITKSRSSTLGKLSTACLETGEVQEACHLGLAPTSSTTVMLALGDALAIAVAKANDFREEDFARNHPAGALGLRFRAVRGVMRTGDRVVCVNPEMKITEVVKRVSAAKVGAAIIVKGDGTLLGIFTDGDLRRALLKGGDVLEQAVAGHATAPCRRVSACERISDAVKIVQNHRIEELPVVDTETGKVIGLLCLKDIAVF
jgi:arabinose-5-phosphate isomerase